MRDKRTARSWREMRQRCLNPNSDKWKWYGGKGIKICDEWSSYEAFFEDMGIRPPGMTLDRINVDGDYCKENCRWATSLQQGANKTNNVLFEFNGEQMHMSEVARKTGIRLATIWQRLKNGWTKEQAITIPILKNGHSGAPKKQKTTAKLSKKQELEIAASKETTKNLASRYGVCKNTISAIKRRSKEASNRMMDRNTQ